MSPILEMLNLKPSPQSIDYVERKKQFHLHNLQTEQRHPKTWNLSSIIKSDTEAGLRMLLSVDEDIAQKVAQLVHSSALLDRAVSAIVDAVQGGHKVFIYGCGATGRLAKQMESACWRPFWRKVKGMPCWDRLKKYLPDDMDDVLIGEMTGGDRALVSSLEGFEDLQLIGKLQLLDRQVSPGDVVLCITEGGETSSVIGAMLAAAEQYGELDERRSEEARRRLYFIYNNPDDLLLPIERCASVLDNPGITRINLATGQQAIAGSTRMQAATIETFVTGMILEEAVSRILRQHLEPEELAALSYRQDLGLRDRLESFRGIKAAVDSSAAMLTRFTQLESSTCRQGRFTTYFAKSALITVFTDCAERSPTFRLHPLDRVSDAERRSWVQVWTEASDSEDAWQNMLGRRFKGLDSFRYRTSFEQQADSYLKETALHSLMNAGDDEGASYDFSFARFNLEHRGPQTGDLGVLVLMDEEVQELKRRGSSFHRFLTLFHESGARVAVLLLTDTERASAAGRVKRLLAGEDAMTHLVLDAVEDPLKVRRQIALKMLLNAHSTGIMATLGRVIGNTMTSVSPSNLKLIGRATYLIMSHVNDVLVQSDWARKYGCTETVTFSEANGVLYDALEYTRSGPGGQIAEVALSIIRIIEAFKRRSALSWKETRRILDEEGLEAYLTRHNRALTVMRPSSAKCVD